MSNIIRIGHHEVEVTPVKLKNLIEIAIILSPHIDLIIDIWPKLSQPNIGPILLALRDEMSRYPGDLTRCFALLIDRDYEWVARNLTAEQFLQAIPAIDAVNNLGELIQSVEVLWQLKSKR